MVERRSVRALTALLIVGATVAAVAPTASAFTKIQQAVGTKFTGENNGNITFEATEEAAPKTTVAVICTKASAEGEVASTISATLTVKYSGCTVAGLAVTITDKCMLLVTLTVGTNTGTGDIKGSKCATIEVNATKCKMIIVGEQKGVEKATLENNMPKVPSVEVSGAASKINFESPNGKSCGFAVEKVKGTATLKGKGIAKGVSME